VLNKNLSQFQRRYVQLFSSSIIFTAFLTLMVRTWFKDYHPTGTLAWLLATIPALPFIGTAIIASRYVANETDEYIRAQVLLALLQGSLITLVFTIVYSFLQNFLVISGPPAMFYVDIFLIASMIALRIHLRSGQ
jgi:hypothetical protein